MRLLTLNEVKKMLNVDKRTLHRWDKSEKLIATRTAGGHRRYKEQDVKAMMGEDFIKRESSENGIVESFRTTSDREFMEDLNFLLTRYLKKVNNKPTKK